MANQTRHRRIIRMIDLFTSGPGEASRGSAQLRVLVGGALLGLALSGISVVATAALGFWVSTGLVLAFAAGLLLLLLGVRSGWALDVLASASIGLLGAFFVSGALLMRDLEWSYLKWLSLLPMVALFLDDANSAESSEPGTDATLVQTTVLAVLLALLTAALQQSGLVSGVNEPHRPAMREAWGVLDAVLFTLSLSGLLWVGRLASSGPVDQVVGLHSMLSVCAWCRRVKDVDEGWMMLEHYVNRHTHSRVTHGICPACERQTLDDASGHHDESQG